LHNRRAETGKEHELGVSHQQAQPVTLGAARFAGAPEENRVRRAALTGVVAFTFYAVLLSSCFALRPQASTFFVFNAFSGHDGMYFFGIALDPLSSVPRAEKHRYLRIAYPALASVVARGLDVILPTAWLPSRIPMQGTGPVPRFYWLCAVSLVILDLLFLALASSSLYMVLAPRLPAAFELTLLLLVVNFVVASSVFRSLVEPLVLLAVFRFQLAWQRSPWSSEIFFWAIVAPFIKEYLLVLPVTWVLVQLFAPEPDALHPGSIHRSARWVAASIGFCLFVPYAAYWYLVAVRFGESVIGLKSSHAQAALGLPVIGYLRGVRDLLFEPLEVTQQSRLQQLLELGYRLLHFAFYLMLLFFFFVRTPRTLWQLSEAPWLSLIHWQILALCLFFPPSMTHSAGDLGRVMAASPAFWMATAAQLQARWWRIAWIPVNVGLILAQWARALVLASHGGMNVLKALETLRL
jgi:hypothetical protein